MEKMEMSRVHVVFFNAWSLKSEESLDSLMNNEAVQIYEHLANNFWVILLLL